MAKSSGKIEQQAIALAGVAQVARMVDQISKSGSYPVDFLEPSVNSLFVFDMNKAEDLFGGIGGVKLGLQNLSSILASRQAPETRDVVRYVFSILHLERQFATNASMQAVVRSRLEHASFKSEHFSGHVHDVCHSVSAIYQDTLSTFRFRIKVNGSANHLQNSQNADIIRTLLLAGIRSAFLWRQLGGRRWKLLMQRKQLLEASQRLSRTLELV
ncbi:MAG: high frequency lysogenization protein HflD [Proteobacteria bacterium]|nr:high frequency lysogenization protein HflD [Pseudomonadota bacterium]